MNRICLLIAAAAFSAAAATAQNDHIADGLTSIAAITGETKIVEDSVTATAAGEIPLWKQKLYYGYNFDIYFHHNSKTSKKENGWSISVTPEIGWRLKERVSLGLRFGGSYQDSYTTYSSTGSDGDSLSKDMRVINGSWEVIPYGRYRLKTLFNGKVGVWLEAHLFAGMEFPRVMDGIVTGTDYDGLRYSATYGGQVSPVITYQFNRKSSFQLFFSILSFGYSGTTRFYNDAEEGSHCEHTNDVIIFSGKLKNLISNQFIPGLYGLKFGIQKSF